MWQTLRETVNCRMWIKDWLQLKIGPSELRNRYHLPFMLTDKYNLKSIKSSHTVLLTLQKEHGLLSYKTPPAKRQDRSCGEIMSHRRQSKKLLDFTDYFDFSTISVSDFVMAGISREHSEALNNITFQELSIRFVITVCLGWTFLNTLSL